MSSFPTEYGPLVSELQRQAAQHRQPVSGAFELTNRCNLSCQMCYVRHSANDTFRREKELSSASWLSLAHQAIERGMVFLLLTGGEVFLRPDFFEIYEPLTRMGLMLTLFTNGTLITDDVAERLAKAPPSCTEITLYGATAATYEAVTRTPGSYDRCCAGIEALIKRRVPFGLKTTVTKHNVGELDAMRQMANRWGAPFSAGSLLFSRPDGTMSNVEDCRLSAIDSVALEMADHASVHRRIEATARESITDNDGNFFCLAGKSVFVVNPAGEMNVCLNLPHPSAHPLEIGFDCAWKQIQQYVEDSPPRSSVCSICDARINCMRCPAWSLTETGTLTEPVPYLCEIAFSEKDYLSNRFSN
jgi:MoaA/NifB/PqqE/SkfB family radical SAM enzyme